MRFEESYHWFSRKESIGKEKILMLEEIDTKIENLGHCHSEWRDKASCKGKEEEADGNASATGMPTCFGAFKYVN